MKPSSRDLRSRVVTAEAHRDGSMRHLATTVRMSVSGVRDLITRAREPGSPAPQPPGGGSPATGAQPRLAVVQPRVQVAPDAPVRARCPRGHEAAPVSSRVATMRRALARRQLTREKTVSRHGARARRRPQATGRLPRSEPGHGPRVSGLCGCSWPSSGEGEGRCPRSPRATRPGHHAAASRSSGHDGRSLGSAGRGRREAAGGLHGWSGLAGLGAGGVGSPTAAGAGGGAGSPQGASGGRGAASHRRPGRTAPLLTAVLAGVLPDSGMLVHSEHEVTDEGRLHRGAPGASDGRSLCRDHEPGCERLVGSCGLPCWIHMKNAVRRTDTPDRLRQG